MRTTIWKVWRAALAVVPMLAAASGATTAAEARPQPTTVSPARTAKASALVAKLEAITFDEITFDALPLGEVVNRLIRESARRDPGKTAINFLFARRTEESPTGVDPATGLSVSSLTAEIDVAAATIRLVPPLKSVRLVDVLDAIVRVADRPIKYSIEDYAIVFSPDTARAAPTLLHTYQLDSRTLAASVQSMFAQKLPLGSSQVAAELRDQILPRFGVRLAGPDAELFYNDVTGALLVRATRENQAAVQAVVELLGGGAATNGAVAASASHAAGPAPVAGVETDGGAPVGKPEATPAVDANTLVVVVSAGVPHFRLGTEAVTMAQLQRALVDAARNKPDVRLAIKADKGAPLDRLMRLMEMAQQAKITSVGLVTDDAPTR